MTKKALVKKALVKLQLLALWSSVDNRKSLWTTSLLFVNRLAIVALSFDYLRKTFCNFFIRKAIVLNRLLDKKIGLKNSEHQLFITWGAIWLAWLCKLVLESVTKTVAFVCEAMPYAIPPSSQVKEHNSYHKVWESILKIPTVIARRRNVIEKKC